MSVLKKIILVCVFLANEVLIISDAQARRHKPSDSEVQQAREEREKNRQCSRIGGVYSKQDGCFCPTLNKFINLDQESEKHECYNSFAQEQINTLSGIDSLKINSSKQNCERICRTNNAHFGCPQVLKKFMYQDKESSHLGIVSSPVSQCKIDKEIEPSQLETDINQSNFIESFIPPGLVSSPTCSPQAINIGGGRTKKEVKITTNDRARFVADYYYSMKRLEKGIEQTLLQLASLNEISAEEGHSLLSGMSCNFYEFPALVEKCRKLKQCQAPGHSIDIAEQTIHALQAKDLLEDERDSIRLQSASKNEQHYNLQSALNYLQHIQRNNQTSEPLETLREELEALTSHKEKTESTIEMIDQLYPWINGNNFTDNLSDLSEEERQSPRKVAELIKNQAEATKAELLKKLKKQKQATQCLNSKVYDPRQCKDALEIISVSPQLDNLESYNLNEPAMSALKAAQCRAQIREEKEHTDDLMKGLFLDSVFLAGSLGLGGIIMGGKAAMTVARFLSAGKSTRPTWNMAGALFGVEALASSDHVKQAFEECSKNWNQLESASFQSDNNKCSENIRETATLKKNYKSCLVEAALVSLPLTVPAAMQASKKVVEAIGAASERTNDLHRLRRLGEEHLGTSLTNEQVRAIRKAHLVGIGEEGADGTQAGIGNYTFAQRKRKAEILKEAGFTQEQRRKLIQAGVVGEKNTKHNIASRVDITTAINQIFLRKKTEDERRRIINILRGQNQAEDHTTRLTTRALNNIGTRARHFSPNKIDDLTNLMELLRTKGVNPSKADALEKRIRVRGKFENEQVYHAHFPGQSKENTLYVACWEKIGGTIMITYLGPHPNKDKYKGVCY